jgi:F-type H+-transporting ATPase subunit a
MHQFEIAPIFPVEAFGFDISFTNASLWMCIVAGATAAFLIAASSKRALVPSRLQSVGEIAYELLSGMVKNVMGEEGMVFFPFIFTLFMFILFANMIGMIPGSFTVTSHIAVTAALAFAIFFMVIIVGFWRHGLKFLMLFVPKVPPVLLPLLVPIEIISFLSRPLSHSIRLFANMLAGHTMLFMFGTFVVSLGAAGGMLPALSVLPLLGIVAVTALEFLIAFLQAYVFAILACIYLNDALHLHHGDDH